MMMALCYNIRFADIITYAQSAFQLPFVYRQHCRGLNDERIFWSICCLCAKVFNLVLISATQIVEAQAIPLLIHNRYQFCLQCAALTGVKQTLKYGILDSLSIVDALFCNLSESFSAGGILGVHIVCNDYQQKDHLLPQKWRIVIQIAP